MIKIDPKIHLLQYHPLGISPLLSTYWQNNILFQLDIFVQQKLAKVAFTSDSSSISAAAACNKSKAVSTVIVPDLSPINT